MGTCTNSRRMSDLIWHNNCNSKKDVSADKIIFMFHYKQREEFTKKLFVAIYSIVHLHMLCCVV